MSDVEFERELSYISHSMMDTAAKVIALEQLIERYHAEG